MEEVSMPGHDVVVIGASAGGVEATVSILREAPSTLPAAIFVVVHIPPHAPSHLPHIFSRASSLICQHARDGARILPGHVYVAPPDMHVLVERDYMRVVRGPKENRSRPAIDPLFRTAARSYGPRVIGVVLSGALNDGTAGLLAIKRRGGIAIVQDPDDAVVAMMPESAIEYVQIDHQAPAARIASLLNQLCHAPAADEGGYTMPADMAYESQIMRPTAELVSNNHQMGRLSAFTCPDCRGPLWAIEDGELVRFRCREGHAFTGETVLDGQYEAVEEALWVALETLTESALMARQMAEQAYSRGHSLVAARFDQRSRQADERAAVIRDVLNRGVSIIPQEQHGHSEGGAEPVSSERQPS
jgi:two-component system chemotaxis response regulator CheB